MGASAASGELSPWASPEQGLAELWMGWQKTPVPALRKGRGRCAKGTTRGEYASARSEFENETESPHVKQLSWLRGLSQKSLSFEL